MTQIMVIEELEETIAFAGEVGTVLLTRLDI